MELSEYLTIFRRRKWVIILTTLATIGTAILGYYLIPMEYKAEAVVRIIPYPSGEPSYTQLIYADRVMRTYVEIGSSDLVHDEIRDALGLQEDQPADMQVEIIPDTELLRITVRDPDPMLARDSANALADYLINDKTIREVRVTVVEPSTLPEAPTLLSMVSLLFLAGIVGVVAGIGLALVLNNLDKRIFSEEQVRSITGLPVIGKIPDHGHWSNQEITIRTSIQKDTYSRLATRVSVMLQDNPNRSIMLTSAEPREGKSTTVANLAYSLSSDGKKTILLDADFHQPKIHTLFGLENQVGLADYLLGGEVELSSIIMESGFTNLDIITCGDSSDTTDLLFSRLHGLKKIYQELLKTYDLVLIDTPAFLGVSDSLAIARTVDCILLIAGFGIVKENALRSTVQQIEAVQPNILGVIMNHVKEEKSAYYGTYYYHRKPAPVAVKKATAPADKLPKGNATTQNNGAKPKAPAPTETEPHFPQGDDIKKSKSKSIKAIGPPTVKRQGILMLMSNHSFEVDCRVYLHAQALDETGYQVYTISPRGSDEAWSDYKGNIEIYHYPALQSNKLQIGYFIEFAYATLIMTFYTLWVCLRHHIKIILMANPPDSLFIACILPKLFGKTVVFDLRDPAPELYQAKFPHKKNNNMVYKILVFLERCSCRLANHVITTNQSTRDIMIMRHNLSPGKVSVIRQGPNLDEIHPAEPDTALRARAKTILAYLGNMGSQDGIDYLLQILKSLDERYSYRDWYCVLIGAVDDPTTLNNLAEKYQLQDRLWFTGFLPVKEWITLLSTADICLEPAPESPINSIATMNKIMDYMALSKPFIVFDLHEHRITAGSSAVYVNPNDVDEFAGEIFRLAHNPDLRRQLGATGRKRIENGLDWTSQKRRLLNLYANLSDGKSKVMISG